MHMIWAIDAFDETAEMLAHCEQVISRWAKAGKTQEITVQPVYVLSPRHLSMTEESAAPWIHEYRPAAEKALASLLRDFRSSGRIPGLAPPQIISENVATTRQGVEALSDHAYATGAELILVNSHGRRGLRRIFMGSFAETLLLRSRVPVMIAGPKLRVDTRFDRILVPTEFSEHSRPAFRYLVRFANRIGASITLFHSVPRPIEPIFQSGVYLLGGTWVPVQAYFSNEGDRIRRLAEGWVEWARRNGVEAEAIVDDRGANVSESILAHCRSGKYGIVAMEAHSGSLSAALLGSVTREVARDSECPVWVLRSDMPALHKSSSGKDLPRRAA